MFKRILSSSALALLCSLTHAADAPAWGLIVKLKSDGVTQATTSGAGHAQAQAGARIEPIAATAQAHMQTALRHAGLAQVGHRTLIGAALHHVGSDRVLTHAQAQAMAARLMASGDVEWAVPNEREHLHAGPPNDSFYNDPAHQNERQWWALGVSGTDMDPLAYRLRGVPSLTPAWVRSTGSSSVTIAVLDTGLTAHPDLDTSRLVPGRNFHHSSPTGSDTINANDTTDPGDWLTQSDIDNNPSLYPDCYVQPQSSWHGTAVTGVIAATANNSAGIAGSDWAVKIMPVRIAGKCGAWESDIFDAMNWVAGDSSNGNHKRADVISLSFGGEGPCDTGYLATLRTLKQRGVVVVVSAGNSSGGVERPANCAGQSGTGVVAVAALNRDGFKSNYSNFGSQITVATVGGDWAYTDRAQTQPSGSWGPYVGDSGILTLGNDGQTTVGAPGYYYYEGTSLATPIVSATLSLMLSVNPSLTVDNLIADLQSSARPHVVSSYINTCSTSNAGRCLCTTQTCGAGILDTDRALQVASGITPVVLTPEAVNNVDVQNAAATGQDTLLTAPTPHVSTGSTANHGGGGGGGSLSLYALLALAGATAVAALRLKA